MTYTKKLQSLGAKGLAASLFAATTLTVGLCAQEEAPQQKPVLAKRGDQASAPDYTSTSQLIGANVFLEAARDQEKQPKAEIADVLIDSYTGEVTHAVISVGGFLGIGDKIVLVPASSLKWSAAERRYELGWTVDELEQRTPFDLAKASADDLDQAADYRVIGAAEEAVVEATDGQPAKLVTEAVFIAFPTRLVRGSELMKLPVYAGSGEFGSARDLIIDRKARKVVLAVVNQGATLGVGGTDYLVAFPQFSLCTKDKAAVLCAHQCSAEDLSKSVQYHKPKDAIIDPAEAEKALGTKTAGDGS